MINFVEAQIDNFFKNDVLDFRHFPEKEIANHFSSKYNHIMDVSKISSPKLKNEIKDFIKLIFTGKASMTYTSKYICEFLYFLDYVKDLNLTSIFDISCDEMRENYLIYRHIKDESTAKRLVNALYFHLTELYDTRTGFDRDIWILKNFKLEEIRLNPTSKIDNISFIFIKNLENRELLKKYIKYLISCTEYSLSTIVNILSICGNFSNLVETSILEVTEEDCKKYFDKVNKITKRSDVYNKHVAAVSNFMNYLIIQNIYQKRNPVTNAHSHIKQYEYKQTAIPDFVIIQIFNKLHLLPPMLRTMYVLNFCTGMRISDICQLKSNCLITDKGHFFIKHYVQKMKKYQINIIPESVYKMVQKQIKVVKETVADKKGTFYIFPAPKKIGAPCSTNYYTKQMKKHMAEWEIKNEDGSLYDFKSHAYRHTIATELLNHYDVDLSIIQLGVLGHTEINMSLCYAERRDERKSKYQKVYTGIDGVSLILETEERDDDQILSNGICTNPLKIGACPHYEACLNCEFFLTNIDYLELHKQQLADIEKKIPLYESNGWDFNLETARKQRDSLRKIIHSLEEIQQEGGIIASTTT